jgi:hypothetical protein
MLITMTFNPIQLHGIGALVLMGVAFLGFLFSAKIMEWTSRDNKGWEFGKLEHKGFNPPPPSQWGGQVPTHEIGIGGTGGVTKVGIGGTISVTKDDPHKVVITGKDAKGEVISEEVTLKGTEPVILKGPWI